MVKVILTIIGCLGGEIKEPNESIGQIFKCDDNDKELKWIIWEILTLVP